MVRLVPRITDIDTPEVQIERSTNKNGPHLRAAS
jgi:hypothetical protein